MLKTVSEKNKTPAEQFGGGKSQKKAKGAAGGARPSPLDRRRDSELVLDSEIGSDFSVKSHQIGIKTETVALSGGFFGGGV